MNNEKQEEIKKIEKPDWLKLKSVELENIVIALHIEGNSPAKLGLILRDKYGVPKTKLFGKKVTRIIKEHSLEPKTEKEVFLKKIEALEKHILKNKHDYTAARALTKTLWTTKKREKNHK